MSRTHYSVTNEVAKRLEEALERGEDESATELFERACDRLEKQQAANNPETRTGVTDRNGLPENVLTTAHLDDIVTQTSDKAAEKTLSGIEEMHY